MHKGWRRFIRSVVINGVGLGACVLLMATATVTAWSNGGHTKTLTKPIFGTHDYIAFRGYVMAHQPLFIKQNLNAYF
ncbi:MAG TPA: hypothetical protein VFU28_11080 [Vicinamibacterales bacterium]|nr:hypothetical protein [Vicinamibacterales bacterium]